MFASILSAAAAVLAFLMALALLDQWRERRGSYQLAWAIGSLLFGVGAAARGDRRRRRLERRAVQGLVPGRRSAECRRGLASAPPSCSGRLGSATHTPCSRHSAGCSRCSATPKNHYPDVGTVADHLPDLRPRPCARDRRRDVLPERALAAHRRGRRHRPHGPRHRPGASSRRCPQARSRWTSTACRCSTRCRAACAC